MPTELKHILMIVGDKLNEKEVDELLRSFMNKRVIIIDN